MKKFATAVAVVALVAFAAPVFAATNPFMDVPMNHWAYDAIGQLAAHGILSGYPDGTYKGKQPTTRYEMASALARALAVVDMTKASKQDVEMLKRLVVEFRDELEALGVRVDDLDERVSVLEDRLGGWRLSGQLRLDIRNFGDETAPDAENGVDMTRARLFFDRWFGEDESIHFRAILRGDSGRGRQGNDENWKNFYVEVPFFMDSTLWVGRFTWDLGSAYYLGGDFAMPETGGFAAFDSVLTDRDLDALGWSKQFGLGSVWAYVAHPEMQGTGYDYVSWGSPSTAPDGTIHYPGRTPHGFNAWELFVMAQLQFTEQIGFDIGGQAFIGDNAEWQNNAGTSGMAFDNLWTVFAGLRFNFNDHIAFKGIFYHQSWSIDEWNGSAWVDAQDGNRDSEADHWRAIVHVDQEMLKFTSLWLEYGQVDAGFYVPTTTSDLTSFFVTGPGGGRMPDDLKYWRVALGQEWNEKWATHLFYFGYNFDQSNDLAEWGLGVRYTYNPQVQFGLNFVNADWDGGDDDHVIRFRTQISF